MQHLSDKPVKSCSKLFEGPACSGIDIYRTIVILSHTQTRTKD